MEKPGLLGRTEMGPGQPVMASRSTRSEMSWARASESCHPVVRVYLSHPKQWSLIETDLQRALVPYEMCLRVVTILMNIFSVAPSRMNCTLTDPNYSSPMLKFWSITKLSIINSCNPSGS